METCQDKLSIGTTRAEFKRFMFAPERAAMIAALKFREVR